MIMRLITSAIVICLLLSAGCKTSKPVSDKSNTSSTAPALSAPSGRLSAGKHIDEKNDHTRDKIIPYKKAGDDATQPAP